MLKRVVTRQARASKAHRKHDFSRIDSAPQLPQVSRLKSPRGGVANTRSEMCHLLCFCEVLSPSRTACWPPSFPLEQMNPRIRGRSLRDAGTGARDRVFVASLTLRCTIGARSRSDPPPPSGMIQCRPPHLGMETHTAQSHSVPVAQYLYREHASPWRRTHRIQVGELSESAPVAVGRVYEKKKIVVHR